MEVIIGRTMENQSCCPDDETGDYLVELSHQELNSAEASESFNDPWSVEPYRPSYGE